MKKRHLLSLLALGIGMAAAAKHIRAHWPRRSRISVA